MSLVTILDYWRLVRFYRRMILGLVVCSVVVTGGVSKFILPTLYESSTVIMPARQEATGGGLSLGGGDKDKGSGSGMVMEMMGKSGPNVLDTLQAILTSRTIAEAVSEELYLMEYYRVKSPAEAAEIVRGEVTSTVTRQKALQISVLSHDPQMAADIANAYVTNLDRINKALSLSSTKQHRQFIEKRLEEKAKQLSVAEEAVKTFQTENRSLAVKEQAEAAMQSVSDLHGEIVAKEVELAALSKYANPNHPQINQLRAQMQELRRQLDELEQNRGSALSQKQKKRPPMSQKAFPAFEEAPSLALDFLRLVRQVKVDESVYGMLVGMLEQAKITEVRDLPTIQVLDPAIPPRHKSRPKILENVLASGAVSLILGVLFALFLNYLEQLKAQQVAQVRLRDDAGAVGGNPSNGNGDNLEVYPVSPKEIERFHG